MRRFQKVRIRAGPQFVPLTDDPSGGGIDLLQRDGLRACERLVGHVVDMSVLKEERWINAADFRKPYRRRPFARRVFGGYDEVAVLLQRGGYVEYALVKADRRRPHAAGVAHVQQRELLCALQAVADVRPVEEIAAVVQRQPREVLEGADHQIVVLSHAADAGVGMKAPENRVFVFHITEHSFPPCRR